MKKAIFLDRDGCINDLIFNNSTMRYESPHYPKDFKIIPKVKEALYSLKELDFIVIVVSNQPDYALGKTTYENFNAILDLMEQFSKDNGDLIDEFNYCFHHPNAIIKELAGSCSCRKPGNKFLKDAIEKYKINIKRSFFIGDQDTDIICGQSLGLATIQIKGPDFQNNKRIVLADYYTDNLFESCQLIKILQCSI